jgi:Arc/MetJ-type ribon-helix-helix transcriptional regulator
MSVSLPEEDVEFLDTYVHDQGAASRSAALHKAVGLLRAAQLEDAWASWDSSDDPGTWDAAVAEAWTAECAAARSSASPSTPLGDRKPPRRAPPSL